MHQVRIEKRRELFVAGFRPQVVTAFVDGAPVATGVSRLTPAQIRTVAIIGIVCGLVLVGVIAWGITSIALALSQLG